MPNPLIAQGTLNRLQATITWTDNSTLNIIPSFLGKQGIRLALEGETTNYIDTMTGAVRSPVPYMRIRLTIPLLKTQGLAQLYKNQMEDDAFLGDGLIFPDVPPGEGLGVYALTNCAIMSVGELNFEGTDAVWGATVGGYYLVNASLWG